MWTGKCVSFTANPNGLTATLVYEVTDGVTTTQTTEANVSSPDSVDQIINDKVTYLNRVDAQKAAIAAINPKDFENVSLEDLKARKAPPPPTQDELDKQTWFALKTTWQKDSKILESGLSKSMTQEIVDADYAAMKAAYKDEYGAFL